MKSARHNFVASITFGTDKEERERGGRERQPKSGLVLKQTL